MQGPTKKVEKITPVTEFRCDVYTSGKTAMLRVTRLTTGESLERTVPSHLQAQARTEMVAELAGLPLPGGPFVGQIVLFLADPDQPRPFLITSVLDPKTIEGILFHGGQKDGASCKWLKRNVRGMPPNDTYPYILFHKVTQGEGLGQWQPIPVSPRRPVQSVEAVATSTPAKATKTTSAPPVPAEAGLSSSVTQDSKKGRK